MIRPAADGERLAAQGRIVKFFDRTEEGIQVEVQDGARHMEIIYLVNEKRSGGED